MASETVHDVTTMPSEYIEHAPADSPGCEPVTQVIYPTSLNIKVGNLEVVADAKPGAAAIAGCNTRLLLDGKPFPVRSIKLEGAVDGVWSATLEFYPNRCNKEEGV